MQEQDNPADFRWRCIHADNPAANRLATPDCRNLSSVRANRTTEEEAAFARTGRQAPRIVMEPQDVQITEDGTARFLAKAEGIPRPTYQWFSVDRTDNGQPLTGETNPELALTSPTLGKSRYAVQVSNSAGDVMSRVATLSVEQKLRLAQSRRTSDARPIGTVPQKSASDIENQRNRLEAEKEEKRIFRKQRLKRTVVICLLAFVVVLAIAGVIFKNPALRSNIMNHLAAIPFLNHRTEQANPPTETNNSPSQTSATNAGIRPGNNVQKESAKSEPTKDQGVIRELQPKNSILPPDWSVVPIGSLTATNATYNSGASVFNLSAAAEGFNSFFFVCKTNFDEVFKTSLVTLPPPSNGNMSGIMIRDSADTNSQFLFIGASSEKILVFLRDEHSLYPWSTNVLNQPVSLRLIRGKNGLVDPEYSFDSKPGRWTPVDSRWTIRLKKQFLVGFAISSGNLSNTNTAQFEFTQTTGKSQ
jgi:hypothetical protein